MFYLCSIFRDNLWNVDPLMFYMSILYYIILWYIYDYAYGWTTERVVVTISNSLTSWDGVGWGINVFCSKNFQLRYWFL